MKKLVKILALVLIITILCTALVACKPNKDGDKDDDGDKGGTTNGRLANGTYNITPLQDLHDYSTDSVPAVSYTDNDKAEPIEQLTAKIDELNNEYYDDTLNTMQKILKNADATAFINALDYSELPANQMKDLVAYIASGTSVDDAKKDENVEKATGLIEDYSAIEEWTDEMDGLATTSETYKDIYRKRAKKSYAMNTKLSEIGTSTPNGKAMDGGQAARALIEVIQYAESVVAGPNMMGADGFDTADMTDYFKTVLYAKMYDIGEKDAGAGKYERLATYDWDTSAYSLLVTIRSFNHLRWGNEGQTKGAVVKTGEYNKANIAANDKTIVKAWGYSYDYEMASYKALTKTEYYKNIEYSLMSHFDTDADAIEAATIQRKLYTKAYRYTGSFYEDKYLPATVPVSQMEELYEACVYGFTTDDSNTWGQKVTTFNGVADVKIDGLAGKTEGTISYKLGALSDKYTATFQRGVNVGMTAFLLSTDMEHYYSQQDSNATIKKQAKAQRTMDENSNRAEGQDYSTVYYDALFDLDMENLKSSQFVVDEFLKEDSGSAELGSILKYQIYNYQSDYIRSINQLKTRITMDIQSLVNDGVYTKESDGYKKVAGAVLSEEQEDVIYEIGRNCAVLDSMKNDFGTFSANNQIQLADGVQWKGNDTNEGIEGNINTAVKKSYTQYSGKNKVDTLQNTLIKKIWVNSKDATAPTYENFEDIPAGPDSNNYVEDYDTTHQLSRLLNNHDKVVYYTAGQVQIYLQKGVGFSTSAGIEYEKHSSPDYDNLIGGYEDEIGSFDGLSLFERGYGGDIDADGVTYEPDDTWYLRKEYKDGEMNYFYEVTKDDSFRYDVTLYMGYTKK